VALFSPRNIVKGSFKVQYLMPGEDTADAVTVEYFSSRTWKSDEETVALPDSAAEQPAKVSLFGCTDTALARREGLYMAAANRYRRRMVTFRTELEGLIPTYGDLIAVAHDLPRWGQGGEVIGWDSASLTLTLSEPLEWSEGTHWIALRKRDGSVAGPFEAAPGATAQDVVLAEDPGFAPYTGTAEERTHFAFGPGEAWSLKARVLAVRPRGEQIEIACVGEHDAVHDADVAA
jgi:predicted phage tail protein